MRRIKEPMKADDGSCGRTKREEWKNGRNCCNENALRVSEKERKKIITTIIVEVQQVVA